MCALNISWLANSTAPGGKPLSLLQPLLDAVATAHEASAALPEALTALDHLKAALVADAPAPGAGDAAALAHDWAVLNAALGDKLPAALRPLGDSLAQLSTKAAAPGGAPGVLTFALADGKGAQDGAPMIGGLQFKSAASLAGQAQASVEADASVPDWAQKLGYQLAPDQCLFRVGLSGALDGAASTQAKPAWGGIGVTATAQAAAHLDYCYNYDGDWLVAQALARSLAVLPAPGDLTGMLGACAVQQFGLASLDVAGSASIKGDLTLGKALVGTLAARGDTPAWSPVALGADITAGAKLAASITAQWSLDGDYHLTVRNAPGGPIARLDRAINRGSGAAIDIAATLGVDGVTAALDPLMTQILPSAAPLIASLGTLADFGGMVRSALGKAFNLDGSGDWDATAQAMVDLASGGGVKASAALTQAIKDRLVAYGKDYLAQGSAKAQDVADAIAASIAAELPSVPNSGKLNEALQKGLTALQAAIKGKLDVAIVGSVDGAIATLAKNLSALAGHAAEQASQALGRGVGGLSSFVTDLQKGLTSATAPLAAWLQSYEAARARVAKAIGQLQSRKLGFDVAASYRRAEGRVTLLEVQFQHGGAAAQALYGALWSGQLDERARLISEAEADGAATVLQDLFTHTLERESKFGFSLNLFDWTNVQASADALDKLELRSAGGDRIVAVRDSVDVAATVLVNGDATTMSLNVNLELLALADVTPPLSAEFKAAGAALTREQVQTFFRLLEASGAVSPGTGGRVGDYLFAGAAGTAARVAQASIGGACVLDRAGWATLLATPAATLSESVRQSCLRTLTLGLDAEPGVMDGTPQQWLANWCDYTGWSEAEFWQHAIGYEASRVAFSDFVFGAARDGQDVIVGQGPFAPGPQRRSLHLLWEIQKITSGCRDAWRAVEAEAALLADLNALPTRDPEATYNTLAALSATVRKGLARAFTYEIPNLSQPVKVSWRFLGLMLALSKTATPDLPPTFVVSVDTLASNEPATRLFV